MHFDCMTTLWHFILFNICTHYNNYKKYVLFYSFLLLLYFAPVRVMIVSTNEHNNERQKELNVLNQYSLFSVQFSTFHLQYLAKYFCCRFLQPTV